MKTVPEFCHWPAMAIDLTIECAAGQLERLPKSGWEDLVHFVRENFDGTRDLCRLTSGFPDFNFVVVRRL